MTGLGDIVATARREVLVLGGPPAGVWPRVAGDSRRGVRYRVVVPADGLDPDGLARVRSLLRHGALVRAIPEVPTELVIVDRATVAYPWDSAVLRFPGVVATAVELFERTWAPGRPLTSAVDPLSAQDRAVLTLLSAGCADETMANRLGVSVRTVRRRVSDLMARLGARSRFQAGVRAAARGWLPHEDAEPVPVRAG